MSTKITVISQYPKQNKVNPPKHYSTPRQKQSIFDAQHVFTRQRFDARLTFWAKNNPK